jgi:hypothetical protein
MKELKQRVWRTVSETAYGCFVWDVTEVMGEPHPLQIPYFIQCLDGSYLLIQCTHYWTNTLALMALSDNEYDYLQELILIKG